MASGNEELLRNGWAAVQRSHFRVLADMNSNNTTRISVGDISLPDTDLARKTFEFAKSELPEKTFNHSLRVYYYGAVIIRQHFLQWTPLLDTYYLTCLLHDLGTIDYHLRGTRMSFEYYGAFEALNFLRQSGATKDQAESVCEAIIRHADLGETGSITSLGQLIQLSTVFDNLGANPHLIHRDTIESIVAAFPRKNWSNCFANTMREEVGTKPWCHSTANEGFIEAIESNELMEPWE